MLQPPSQVGQANPDTGVLRVRCGRKPRAQGLRELQALPSRAPDGLPRSKVPRHA